MGERDDHQLPWPAAAWRLEPGMDPSMTETERAALAASVVEALRADASAMVVPGTRESVLIIDTTRRPPLFEPVGRGLVWRMLARLVPGAGKNQR
jgi:hypothetical protein